MVQEGKGLRPREARVAERIVIKGGAVVTLNEKNEVFDPGEVVVEEGRLVYVGPPRPEEGGEKEGRLIKARDMVIMPGLINAHTHAAMTLLRGYGEDLPLHEWLEKKIFPAEDRFTPEDVYWGSLLAIAEMIRSGTTCFADMYFFMDQVAEAVAGSGIRACLARGLVGVSPTAGKALAEARALVRDWQGVEGRITTMLGPHAPYTCPEAFLKQVAEVAGELGVGLHIHVGETRREYEEHLALHGCTQVATLQRTGLLEHHVLLAHGVYLTDEDMVILAEASAAVAHNPTSNLKLGNGVARVKTMREKGLTVAIGTDGAASNNDLDMFEELRLTALLQKGTTGDTTLFPAAEVLAMATREGAKALGLGGVVGSLEPGLAADLILVDMAQPHLTPCHDVLANLVYAAHGGDVRMVMVGGRILYDHGEFLTLDEERIRFEVNRRRIRN